MSWLDSVIAMLPEHCVLAGILLLLVLECAGRMRSREFGDAAIAVTLVATALGAASAAWLAANGFAFAAFPGHYSVDAQALLGKAIVLGFAVPAALIAHDEARERAFSLLLLSSLYGICLMLSSDSFLTLFLGLELMSLPVYALILLAYRRPESAEAALKYLVLGGTASAILLMGVALLYGATGSVALSAFAQALGSNDAIALAAVVLVLLAFFLKAAIVPFHAWAPDAYEGASIAVSAYMTTIVKAGVLLAAVRLFGPAQVVRPAGELLALLPLASIVWGNLAAMRQQSFRRMIAYSSIAHAGYLYYAFLGDAAGRFQAVAFYVLAYGAMNLAAFAALPRSDNDAMQDRLDTLRGLFHRRPYAALAIGAAMLSLAGIPPFPGFIAKFLVFKNVFAAGYTLYAVLGLVASYLGIYFYLRVIQFLFMSPDESRIAERSPGALAFSATVVCLALSAYIAIFPGRIVDTFPALEAAPPASASSAPATSSAMSRQATSVSRPSAFNPSPIIVAQ